MPALVLFSLPPNDSAADDCTKFCPPWPDLYGPSGVNWKVPMRGGACEGRARYRRKLGAGRFEGSPPLARLSRHKLVFGRSEGIATMMQSCASAAKLRGGGSILVRGAKAMSAVGSPPPRLVNGGP